MKGTLLILLLITGLLCLSSTISHAQTPDVVYENLSGYKDPITHLKLFTGKYREGKNYLHWVIGSKHVNGLYIVYRSHDGVLFELVGAKEAIAVPVSIDIEYYLIDNQPKQEMHYYKLLFSEGTKVFVSEVINIE